MIGPRAASVLADVNDSSGPPELVLGLLFYLFLALPFVVVGLAALAVLSLARARESRRSGRAAIGWVRSRDALLVLAFVVVTVQGLAIAPEIPLLDWTVLLGWD